jgi:hypothetical protein
VEKSIYGLSWRLIGFELESKIELVDFLQASIKILVFLHDFFLPKFDHYQSEATEACSTTLSSFLFTIKLPETPYKNTETYRKLLLISTFSPTAIAIPGIRLLV